MVIEYGFRKDKELIPSVLVDDGDSEKSSRVALADPECRFAGYAAYEHSEYDYVLLMLLAANVTLKEEPLPFCRCTLI